MQKDNPNAKAMRQVRSLMLALSDSKVTTKDMELVLPLFVCNIWGNLIHTQDLDAVEANMDMLKNAVVNFLETKGWKRCPPRTVN